MIIRKAKHFDFDYIHAHDNWISRDALLKKINDNQVYVVFNEIEFVGWLRHGLFFDNIPYMNMLYLLEKHRGKGIGRQFVSFWEEDMKRHGHQILLTSSAQTGNAQHFYVKLGYKAIGGFTLADEPLEIMFAKFI